MKKSKLDLNISGIILSSIGVILSAILIFEYYGSLSDVFQTLCHTDGTDGCRVVADSEYSAFRGIPFFGEIPIALLGFTFYGFIGYMYFLAFKASTKKERDIYHDLIFTFIAIAVVVDIALLGVSVFKIGTVCNLCLSTYGVTLFLLLVAIYQKRISSSEEIFEDVENINVNKWNYLIAIMAFFAAGLLIGKIASGNGTSVGGMDKDAQIKMLITEYEKSPVLKIDLTDAPIVGDKNAPITIVKFHDFNCGHCMHTSKILDNILSNYKGIVKVAYKNFPLDGNCNRLVQRVQPGASSCVAATASICANEQGKFHSFYDSLFEDNEKGVMHSTTTVLTIAKNSGVNIDQFNACMSADKTRKILTKDIEEAAALKIEATPTLYLNNKKLISGTPELDFMKAIIDHLMK